MKKKAPKAIRIAISQGAVKATRTRLARMPTPNNQFANAVVFGYPDPSCFMIMIRKQCLTIASKSWLTDEPSFQNVPLPAHGNKEPAFADNQNVRTP